jgi:lipopolysaccharide export system ATP-binding protein
MLDEPFANIDPLAIHDVQQMIRHLVKRGIAILITDHNAREIFSIVDRSYLVQAGTVLRAGSVEDLINDDTVRRTYLGTEFKL